MFWDSGWSDAGQGWQSKDGKLRLLSGWPGWAAERRVVVLRRALKEEILLASEDGGQGLLGFVEADRKTEYAGQTTITLTGLHAGFAKDRDVLTRVSAMLHDWTARAAEQLNPITVWHHFCAHLKHVLAAVGPPNSRCRLENLAFACG